MSNELFDIVDDDDRVIGQAPRGECHGNPELIHRAVHVLVFNPEGLLLLQKRSMEKDIQPGRWDTSVGGHLEVGESYLAAGRREMAEELGIQGVVLTYLYDSKIRNEIESENIKTYLARYEGDIRFAPEEITEVRYWSAEEIEQALGSDLFTPNFEEEWAMYSDFERRVSSTVDRPSGLGMCAGDSFPDLFVEQGD